MLGRVTITRSGGGNSGVAPMNVKNIIIKPGNENITISWEDPEDTIVEGATLCKWKGTKVIYKAGSYPTGPTDGTVVVDNQEKNAYKENGFQLNGLTNGVTYYFSFYPYSDKKVYNKNEVNRVTGTPTATIILGVKRTVSASGVTWERTDDAIGMVANAIKSQSDLTSDVKNDFDKQWPYSEIITVNYDTTNDKPGAKLGDPDFDWTGAKGQVMTYIPEHYYKIERIDGVEYRRISNQELPGYTRCPSFYIGRFTMSGSSSGVFSRSGYTPLVSTNITDFRNYAKKLGTGWGQLDWRYFILQNLYLIEYANNDVQTTLGQGVTNTSAAIKSGGCNDLGMKSGCLTNDGKNSVIYRGIEDIFGNVYQFVDGLNIKDRKAYICYDPTKYAVDTFTGDYKALSYTNYSSDGYVSELGLDTSNPLINLPTKASGSSSTYFPDYYYQTTGNRIARVGGRWNNTASAGLWYWGLNDYSDFTSTYIGARLLKYQT